MPWGAAIGAVASIGGALLSSSSASSAASDASDAQVQASKYAADIQKQMFEEQRSDTAPYRAAGQGALGEINALLGLAAPTAGTTTYVPGTTIPGTANPQAAATQPKATELYARIAQLIAQQDGKNYFAPNNQTTTTPGTTVTTPGLTSAQQQQDAFDKFRADPGYQFSVDQGQQAIDRSAAARGILNSGATAKALDRFGTGIADQEYGNYFARLQSLAGVGQTATNSGNQAAQNYANQASSLAMQAGDARASGYINSANAFTSGINGVGNAINSGIGNYFALNGVGSSGASYGANIPYNVNGMSGSYPTIDIG